MLEAFKAIYAYLNMENYMEKYYKETGMLMEQNCSLYHLVGYLESGNVF